MPYKLDVHKLVAENVRHAGTGGVSEGCSSLGFRPAFLHCDTMQVYPCTFADGRPAPFHILDGLPDALIAKRLRSGRVTRTKVPLVSGFERGGFFYTRAAAARACREWLHRGQTT